MKNKLVILCVLIILLSCALGVVGYRIWQQSQYVYVDEIAYEKDMTYLDLRGSGATLEHYETIRSMFPDCEIRYDLSFQGSIYPDDTEFLTVTSLTEEDVLLLDYLPALKSVYAEGCRDYEALMQLAKRRPECNVYYTVPVLGQEYSENTESLHFTEQTPSAQELTEALKWLPDMKEIYFYQPQMPPEDLVALRETWPNISITWKKDAFGETYSSDVTEIDLSGMYFTSLEEVEQGLAWFPDLEKVIMCECGYGRRDLFDNETMAAFREKMRPHCKVVWSMKINGLKVRTDDTYFMPVKYGVSCTNYQVQQLIYCEDMICVDLGHMPILQLDWVRGMPHLKFLIVADGPLLYIEPLADCKELVYLELFMTEVSDFTPLLECTSLVDLNVSMTNGDPMVFKDMPWLENLWINRLGVTKKEHAELQEALPNTRIESQHGLPNGNGWRLVENYFVMRDLLGMPYNTW